MSYGSDMVEFYERTATYVDKVLKGARPGDLPVERRTTFKLVINMKTANSLKLDVPQISLAEADEVIE